MFFTVGSLESEIRSQIPALSKASFSVHEVRADGVVISARLQDHLNHKGTAFGGSIYQVALVASYGLFLEVMRSHGIKTNDFVIARGDIHYKAPVTADFFAKASLPTEAMQDFVRQIQDRRKGELLMTSVVSVGPLECAQLKARFVAFWPPRP